MLSLKWTIAGGIIVIVVAIVSWVYELNYPDRWEPTLLMPPVTISIVKKEYVNLCIGEPCRWLKFKLDRSSDVILIHPGARSSESPTYWSSANSNRGSDYFYFDNLRLRLTVYEAPVTLMGFADEFVPDGTLGLGEGSPLWLYWRNYTISSRRLYLGQYQHWAQQDPDERPPIFFFDESVSIVMGDGTEAEAVFDFRSENSLVPLQCDQLTAFERIELRGSDCRNRYARLGLAADNCRDDLIIYPSQFQEIMLQSKVEYMAIDYSEDGKVHLGARLFWEIATHFNFAQRCIILAADVYSLDYIGFGMIVSLCIMLALFLWPILATSRPALESEFQFLLILLLEFFCYTVDIAGLLVSFTTLDWCRYITQFAERSDGYAMFYIIGILVLALLFSIVEACRYRIPYFDSHENPTAHKETVAKFRATFSIRVVLFASSQVSALWLFMVEEHEPTLDQAILLYLLSLVIFLQTLIIFSCYIYDKYLELVIVVAISLATIVFMMLYSLFPFLRYSNIHQNYYVVALGWLVFLVWSPAFVCSVVYEIDGHKRRKLASV